MDVNTKFTICQLVAIFKIVYLHPVQTSKFTLWHLHPEKPFLEAMFLSFLKIKLGMIVLFMYFWLHIHECKSSKQIIQCSWQVKGATNDKEGTVVMLKACGIGSTRNIWLWVVSTRRGKNWFKGIDMMNVFFYLLLWQTSRSLEALNNRTNIQDKTRITGFHVTHKINLIELPLNRTAIIYLLFEYSGS